MRKLLFLFVLLLPLLGYAQEVKLSSEASIHIVTVGPFQPELYSAFGHSGIRVYDHKKGIDDFYNYGVFDFNQPNFYLNFARGFLNYRLAVMDYQRVKNFYAYQNRYIHEQVLNLDSAQTQKLYAFLEWNAQPENMYYYYDYFYDNCATRVRDAVEQTFGEAVKFDNSYITTDYTIRDLTDIYLQEQPWGDLGIDICLGLPMDKKATPYMYMFLPDYIEQAFDHATIKVNGSTQPLVKRTIITYESTPESSTASAITPLYLFSFIAIVFLLITWRGYKNNKHKKWIDIVFFTIIGLVGWLLFILWVATDHNAAATNFNLLWAFPLHFPLVFWLFRKQLPLWLSKFYLFIGLLSAATVLLWAFLPQDLHNSLIPITLIVMIRSLYIHYYYKLHARTQD